MGENKMNTGKGRIVALVGMAGVILGSLLPWASVDLGELSIKINGTEGDGTLTIGLAVVGGLLLLWRKRAGAIIGGIAALLAFLTGAYDWSNVRDIAGDTEGLVSVGYGLILVTLAAVVAVAGYVMLVLGARPVPDPVPAAE